MVESSPRDLAALYQRAHDYMRNVDGLTPQESFDELLKYLLLKRHMEKMNDHEARGVPSVGLFEEQARKRVSVLRRMFKEAMKSADESVRKIWNDDRIHLSDEGLAAVDSCLGNVNFSSLPIDTRSAALNTFLSPEHRRGLGIFLTPDAVAKTIVEVLNPKSGESIIDPACGTGTFLIELIRKWKKQDVSLHLSKLAIADKNPKMLFLANTNLNNGPGGRIRQVLTDSLFPANGSDSILVEGFYDCVITNPPFGVVLDQRHHDFSKYESCRDSDGSLKKSQQSEIVFLEMCLRLLRPGGRLAIVLPKSILSNTAFSHAREAIGKLGYLDHVIMLPAETFQLAGTQTSAVVLFMRRYRPNEDINSLTRIALANITNVGYDTTGRYREGNQLELLARKSDISAMGPETPFWRLLPETPKRESLTSFRGHATGRRESGTCKSLGELVEHVGTGLTAARNAYTDRGLFILKVGNLKGAGIDFMPRDRNFVSSADLKRREGSKRVLFVRPGDILMTSSAHAPRYIGEKVDIVSQIPESVGGKATFVGELMLIRANPSKIDPLHLLAYLRMEKVKQQIRDMVRGQTAHLHAEDLLELQIPDAFIESRRAVRSLRDLLQEEQELARASNINAFRIAEELMKIENVIN